MSGMECAVAEIKKLAGKAVATPVQPLPFDLEAAKAGKPIITRDGRKVRYIGHVPEAKDSHKVVAFAEQCQAPYSYYENGSMHSYRQADEDLFMLAQKKTVYVNLYENSPFHKWFTYDSKEEAESVANRAAAQVRVIAVAVPVEIDA